jgi:large conductance mechanosensitive channel
MFEEFKKFILRGNVVDLAVGVIIGAAFGDIVKSMVADVIMPPIAAITGGVDFSHKSIMIPSLFTDADGVRKDIPWKIGSFLQNVVNFLIIGFCLFMVIRTMNRFTKKKEEVAAPPAPTEQYLKEIRDLLQKQNR